MSRRRAALAVGGSDPSGGAGVQADLRVFGALGVHGCSAVTCVTAQNTRKVFSVFPIPPGEVRRQLDAVIGDIHLDAVKLGVLLSPQVARTVAGRIGDLERPIVFDPVLEASVGAKLATADYIPAIKKYVLPITDILTPNVDEASRISGLEVRSLEDVRRAAKELRGLGPSCVLVKGFLERTEAVDVLLDSRGFSELRGPRSGKSVHGTGCALASALAAELAKGAKVRPAVARARALVAQGIADSYAIGRGMEVLGPPDARDRYLVLKELEEGVKTLKGTIRPAMIPEVGINFGYALPFASGPGDVCAIRGRLFRAGAEVRAGEVDFGSSKHVATIILTAMRVDPTMRSGLNLRYDRSVVEKARRRGMEVGSFDRNDEPEGRSTMEWGVEWVARERGGLPDLIYDLGSVGKEGMIRVLGRNPDDVLRKVRLLTGG